jgi:hypothetical protein
MRRRKGTGEYNAALIFTQLLPFMEDLIALKQNSLALL